MWGYRQIRRPLLRGCRPCCLFYAVSLSLVLTLEHCDGYLCDLGLVYQDVREILERGGLIAWLGNELY